MNRLLVVFRMQLLLLFCLYVIFLRLISVDLFVSFSVPRYSTMGMSSMCIPSQKEPKADLKKN